MMQDGTLTYHCKNCGAGLLFDAETKGWRCEFCLSSFTKEELDSEENREREAREEAAQADFSDQVRAYHCESCGAEIIAEASVSADFCYYCHNPVILTGKVSGALRPHKIIPFKLDREAAKETFLSFVKKYRFVPKAYFSEAQLTHLSGVYFPFWVTDADTSSDYRTRARRVRSWTSGDYRYTETTVYRIERAGEIHFEDIVTSAISSEDKKMLEGILPYPSDAHEDFDMPYLLGYTAKVRDIEREALSAEVRSRMEDYSRQLYRDTVSGYSSVDSGDCDVSVLQSHWSYTLLPVWIMTYRDRRDRVYTYAMNGYTGKVYGELPVSIQKLLLLFATLFPALFGVLFLLGGLFL